ncbi:hypothetical protein FRB90_011532 [Tulasnella sp. 427]|nr:hypothetical protein FRB90_011532 [Tulasnella sp. 427]
MSKRNISSIFAYSYSRPGTQSSQPERRVTASRSSNIPATASSAATSALPETPPDHVGLAELGDYNRGARALRSQPAHDRYVPPTTTSTAIPFAFDPPQTASNLEPPLYSLPSPRVPNLGEDSDPPEPQREGSSHRVSLDLEAKDVEALGTQEVPSGRNNSLYDLEYGPRVEVAASLVDEEDSPYPEVRVCVSNADDPDMPVLTFRVWVIGLPLCVLASCLLAYNSIRPAGPALNGIAIILVTYPIGKALAWALPIRSWTLPEFLPWIRGTEFSLNPCPFNIKEHALLFVMINAGNFYPNASSFVVVIRQNYGIQFGLPATFCFELASRLVGLSMVGLGQKLVVERASAIWPSALVYPTVLNTLHAELEPKNFATVPRYRFFVVGTTIAFVYNFLPENVVVNQLTGSLTGLGMSILSFDWGLISSIGGPFYVPWWSQANVAVGFVLACWILAPALYYSDVWKSAHLPMSGSQAFDRFAEPYNLSRILTRDHMLNATAYYEYSPLYLTATFSVLYLASFAVVPALFMYFAFQHGPTVVSIIKGTANNEDVHARLMRHYKRVPMWWYGGVFILCLSLSIISIKAQDLDMPVWMLLVAQLFAFGSYLPLVCVLAWSAQALSLNVAAEVIPGALLPGKPVANMVSKVYGIESTAVALFYTEAFKFGHYLKLPPQQVFTEYMIKRWNFQWWAKYNYILGASLDAGTSVSIVVIAVALGIPKGGTLSLDWWGNNVWQTTADAAGVPYLATDPVKGF